MCGIDDCALGGGPADGHDAHSACCNITYPYVEYLFVEYLSVDYLYIDFRYSDRASIKRGGNSDK